MNNNIASFNGWVELRKADDFRQVKRTLESVFNDFIYAPGTRANSGGYIEFSCGEGFSRTDVENALSSISSDIRSGLVEFKFEGRPDEEYVFLLPDESRNTPSFVWGLKSDDGKSIARTLSR